MKLYEYDAEIQAVIEQADPETGELPEELAETLDNLIAGQRDKAERYLGYLAMSYRNEAAEAEAIKAEKLRLAELQKQAERRAEGVKRQLARIMETYSVGKLTTERGQKLSWRKSTAVVVEDSKQIPLDYWVPQDPALDKQAISTVLKAGGEIPGVRLDERQNVQVR